MSAKDSNREQKTRNRRLTRAAKEPTLALEKRWFEDPKFCQGFFDRCDDFAVVMSKATLKLSLQAVHIAERNGDPHLINRSYGVLSHGFIAARDMFWAGKVLQDARDRALACCPRCRSEHLRREGDFFGEEYLVPESLEALNHSLEEGGSSLSPDARARTLFIRSISHHFDGQRSRSIADAGATLADLLLTSPGGYLVDAVVLLAVFVRGGDPEHDAAALAHVDGVLARIRDKDDWADLRSRAAWVKAHLCARVGDGRRARDQREIAVRRLLAGGLAREAVAATLDLAMLRCRHPEPREDSIGITRREIKACLARRGDIPDALREALKEMLTVLEVYPEGAFAKLAECRRSFIAPVPGVLAERIGVR